MLNSVNEVLIPWTPLRILRIMEDASAARMPGRGGGGRVGPGPSDDSALAMESLLRLSNQQPDVAARVMAAPLFSQRPLLDDAASSPGSREALSLVYADAHHMCTHTLERCRPGWVAADVAGESRSDGDKGGTAGASAASAGTRGVAGRQAYTPATEVGEVAFAADFAEPCLRGALPDVEAILCCGLPAGLPVLRPPERDGGAEEAGEREAARRVQQLIQPLLQEAAVAYRKPAKAEDGASPRPPTPSLRLHLTKPSSAAPAEGLLWSALPPPSAVPVQARGPPQHKLFDTTCLAHTFAAAEERELNAFLQLQPAPFRVYSSAEVRARQQQASAPSHRGTMFPTGSARILGPNGSGAGASHQDRDRATHGRAGGEEPDGWSASSGWSSSDDTENDGEGDGGSGDAHIQGVAVRPTSEVVQGGEAAAEPLDSGSAKEAETAVAGSGEAEARRPAQAARTWVEDDGELVMENGTLTLRKRKVRVARNAPPPLSLPKMVGGPVLRPPLPAPPPPSLPAAEGAVAVREADPQHTLSKDTVQPSPPEPSSLPTQGSDTTSGATKDGKRGRGADEVGADADGDATGNPRKRAKQSGAKRAGGKQSAAGEGKAATAAVVSTSGVPRLSEQELVEFVGQLSVSDLLRRALLLGVQPESRTGADA